MKREFHYDGFATRNVTSMLNPESLTVLGFNRAECVAQFGRSRGLTALPRAAAQDTVLPFH